MNTQNYDYCMYIIMYLYVPDLGQVHSICTQVQVTSTERRLKYKYRVLTVYLSTSTVMDKAKNVF